MLMLYKIKKVSKKIFSLTLFCEIGNKIVISYYIYSNKLFQNYLLVVTHDRQILLNDLIATTEGIGIDTFTLQSDTLLYVKNENYFVGYEL